MSLRVLVWLNWKYLRQSWVKIENRLTNFGNPWNRLHYQVRTDN